MASMRNAQGYVREHRLVMADYIGRPLTAEEIVHHEDHDRGNNHIANLRLMGKIDHSSLHQEDRNRSRRVEVDEGALREAHAKARRFSDITTALGISAGVARARLRELGLRTDFRRRHPEEA